MKRLGIRNPGEPPPPDNRLGDWFATIIYTRHGHYVLLVSERSLLPVLITARDLRNLVPRFLRSLAEVLTALDVPQRLIDRELADMEPVCYGRTNSRVVLGSMNDFIRMFKDPLPDYPESALLEWSLQLAEAPCGPLGMDRPMDVAPRLLRNPYGFGVIEGGQG